MLELIIVESLCLKDFLGLNIVAMIRQDLRALIPMIIGLCMQNLKVSYEVLLHFLKKSRSMDLLVLGILDGLLMAYLRSRMHIRILIARSLSLWCIMGLLKIIMCLSMS